MKTNFDDVGDLHEKYDLDNVTHRGVGRRDVSDDLMQFRIKFLREEIDEFESAYTQQDSAEMFDALLDLVVVAMGTAHLLGYPWQEGWDEVHRANMAKVRAAPDGSDSKRGSSWDIVKPSNWQPPNIENILAAQCPQCRRLLEEFTLKEVIVNSPFPRVDVHCVCGRVLFSRAV